jgi:hypothetical protein
MNGKPYSDDELKTILHLYYNENKLAKDVARVVGRSYKAVQNVVKRYKSMVPEKNYVSKMTIAVDAKKPAVEVVQVEEPVTVVKPSSKYVTVHTEMSPREMIKHLYSLGYRIKNNELVVLVEQKVNIKDIING